MADTIELSVDTRELEYALTRLPQRFRKDIMRRALQAAGDVMLAAVVAETPERDDVWTPDSTALPPGVLKADMHTEIQFSRTQQAARVKVGPSAKIGGLVAYRINYGWMHKDRGGNIKHIPATHFLTRAFDLSAETAVEVFIETLGNALGYGENAIPENKSLDVEFG